MQIMLYKRSQSFVVPLKMRKLIIGVLKMPFLPPPPYLDEKAQSKKK